LRLQRQLVQVFMSNNQRAERVGVEQQIVLSWLRTAWQCAQLAEGCGTFPGLRGEQLAALGVSREAVEALVQSGLVTALGPFYVLTELCLVAANSKEKGAGIVSCPTSEGTAVLVPRWAAGERKLFVGEFVVKELYRQAEVQTTLLNALEEASWAATVANPLAGDRAQRVARLREGVRGLNACQKNRLLHFAVCARGEELGWRLVS
jgi:hypothetical protein